MDNLTEHEKIALRDFLGENWSSFESTCEAIGADADEIYKKLGGE